MTMLDVSNEVSAFTAGHDPKLFSKKVRQDGASKDAPVVKLVQKITTEALTARASDVHIEPQDTQIRVRFRIDGVLSTVLSLPIEMGSAVVSRIKILANMDIVEKRRPQDGQFSMTIDTREVDIRVSTTSVVWGEKVVLRLLDKSKSIFDLASLGMPTETATKFNAMIHSPHGMVICAGPTGSGKSTSLYAALTALNNDDRNITTIEDPVEYVFPSINQIQVNETAGITFASGLRSILRQDPDIIMIGEMRDVETARIAIQSALTGHFVLSTLHATDSVSALYRFLDMAIEPFLIASSVTGIVGQRLVRRVCNNCKVSYTPTPEELAYYHDSGFRGNSFVVGSGCANCSGTGYAGRVGVYELLNVTEQMRELIVQPNPSHDDMRRLAIEQGMSTLRTEAIRLVDNETTTLSEVVRSIYTL